MDCKICGKLLCTRKSYVSKTGYCKRCYYKNPITGERLGNYKGRTEDENGYICFYVETTNGTDSKCVAKYNLGKIYGWREVNR